MRNAPLRRFKGKPCQPPVWAEPPVRLKRWVITHRPDGIIPGTRNSTWARPNRGRAGPGRHDPEVGCSTPGVIWDLDESSLERASAQQKPAYTLIRHYLLTNQLHLPSAPPRCASGLPVINCAFFRIP